MSSMPFFPFYPSDWLGDVKLQACSIGAQGLLINMMCLMHESVEYGVLLISGHIPDTKTIAKLCHVTPRKFEKLFQELTQNEVLRIRDDGAIFCKRMIKDQEVRAQKSKAGAKGGNPNLVNQKVKQKGAQQDNQPVNEVDKPRSSEVQKFREENTNTHLVPTREVGGPDGEPQGGVGFGASPDGPGGKISTDGDVSFLEFAEQYPGYVDPAADSAWRALFKARVCSLDDLYDGLDRWMKSGRWQRGFIPDLSKFLKEKYFAKEPPPEGRARDAPDMDMLKAQAKRYHEADGDFGLSKWLETLDLDDEKKQELCKCCGTNLNNLRKIASSTL